MKWRADEGAGSVLALAVVVLVLAMGACGVALAGLSTARQQAQAAADQAALAVAVSGDCDRGGRLAAANGARLLECRWEGPDVVVGVSAPVPGLSRWLAALAPGAQPPWAGGPGAVAASARAGPPG